MLNLQHCSDTCFIWPQLREVRAQIKAGRETISIFFFLACLKNYRLTSKKFCENQDNCEHSRNSFHKIRQQTLKCAYCLVIVSLTFTRYHLLAHLAKDQVSFSSSIGVCRRPSVVNVKKTILL